MAGLADGSDVVGRISRDLDVPVAFENRLDVLDIERVRATKLGHPAGGRSDRIDKIVDEFQDRLVANQVSGYAGVESACLPLRHLGRASPPGRSA